MDLRQFTESLTGESPENNLPAPLAALWWDAKGDWAQAHALVDDLETQNGMAVHAYLHRKEGDSWNADYWYRRCGKHFRQNNLEAEWKALAEAFLSEMKSG